MDLDKLVEFIDIGGPAMIRAAAKNYRNVAVVVDPGDYPDIISSIKAGEISRKPAPRTGKKSIRPHCCIRCGNQQLSLPAHFALPVNIIPAVHARETTALR